MDNESNIEIGKRLFNARKSKDLTRAELGKLLGLHETTVKRYEDGEIKSLSIEKLKEFAEALDVKPTYLIGWDSVENDKNKILTNEESTLLHKYRKLDGKGKHTVNTVLDMEYSRCNNVLLAAHEKEDVNKKSPTYEEDYKHDLDIMMDDNEWK
ncbi:helix-turn-helix domain-containing protein [Clostridium kluyveri]|uniref:helix-turn-helix domain-containing protein n=1 Tax=Clostridium kluyveri TaxID=1534 RepID=UPI00224610D6|nr:helix-turn-helix transcriptional regulator [Clostridium kluyveri]UZQ49079.1 helix-turn-helix domain-containing protein [Clostridium kluyveri]